MEGGGEEGEEGGEEAGGAAEEEGEGEKLWFRCLRVLMCRNNVRGGKKKKERKYFRNKIVFDQKCDPTLWGAITVFCESLGGWLDSCGSLNVSILV